MKKHLLKLGFLAGLLVFCGCWEYNPTYPPPPPPLPKVNIPQTTSKYISPGSLYKEGHFLYATTDRRARFVGDIITVKIVENYQSSDSVSQKSGKNSSLSAGLSALFGLENKIKSFNPSSAASGSLSASTSGQGQYSRQSKIVATISARVVKVLPNGNLVIEGVRTIKRNKDLEYITLSGIVRPEDIGPDNTILSTQIADAYIEYSGKGPLSEATSGPGIITRLLELLWPF
ncbi:MAG: flagellar basal body L-ring protein FlgH [Thermodesulfobacteria bacterium]|nr:flagellar basal body L-ring protein FlgH [Thermodesulfobacteriota bacterium]